MAEASPLRVAVLVQDDPDLEALLSTKLGKKPGLEILSRRELPALVREVGEFAQSGKLHLSGADRLVVVEAAGEGRAMRVADCSTGVVIAEEALPSNLDADAFSDLLVLRLPRHLRKAPSPEARRVTLQGFRFAENTGENRALEGRINLACAVALQQSGRAVVLERWRMRDLVFENSLQEEQVGPFWSAGTMVNGSIRQAGDRLTLQLEMKNLSGDGGQKFTVEGSLRDLPDLGRRLASAILNAPAPAAGSAAEESLACLEETRWLLKHSLPKEAVQAAESAVALDPGSKEARIMRIRAYARAAYPDDLSLKYYHGAPGYGGVIPASDVGFSVAMAGEMSRLVEEFIAVYPPLNSETLDDPVCLGMRAMHTSLCVLNAAYDHDYFRENPEAVEALRVSTQRNAAALRQRAKGMFLSALDIYLMNYVAYRCATPEETIQEYRAALRRDYPSGFPKTWPVAFRTSLVETLGHNPPLFDVDPTDRAAARPARVFCRLVVWKPGNEQRARDLWETYVNELAASSDPLEKADGLYFRWGAQKENANREKALGDILDFLAASPDVLLGPDGRAIAQMVSGPMQSLSNVGDANLCRRYIDVLTGLFGQDTPLPLEMVRRLSQSFGYRKEDDTLHAELPRLVEAMDGQRARLQGRADRFYLTVLAQAHGNLKALIPPPPRPRPEHALVVRRLWLEQNHATAQGGLDPSSGTWHEGNLWFSEFNRAGFWKINPDNFDSEVFVGANPPDRLNCLNGNCRPIFRDGRIYVSGEDVWSFDLQTKSWRAFGLPRTHYTLYEANGALWAIYGQGPYPSRDPSTDQGTGLYRIDPKKEAAELIFSTRRRPAEHPLDTTEIAAPLGLFAGADGLPVIGLIGNGKRFLHVKDGSPWTDAVADRLWERICLKDRALLVQRFNAPLGSRKPPLLESLVSIDAGGRPELLLSDPRLEKLVSPPTPGKAVWRIPESLNAYPEVGNRYFCPAMVGETLYVLIGDMVGSTQDFTSTLELFLFERGMPDPVRLPLFFEMAEADRAKITARRDNPTRDLNPRAIWHGFVAGEKGLTITCPSGFWFIPMEDVRQAATQSATAGSASTRAVRDAVFP